MLLLLVGPGVFRRPGGIALGGDRVPAWMARALASRRMDRSLVAPHWSWYTRKRVEDRALLRQTFMI